MNEDGSFVSNHFVEESDRCEEVRELTVRGKGIVWEFEVEPGGPENCIVLESDRCSIVTAECWRGGKHYGSQTDSEDDLRLR